MYGRLWLVRYRLPGREWLALWPPPWLPDWWLAAPLRPPVEPDDGRLCERSALSVRPVLAELGRVLLPEPLGRVAWPLLGRSLTLVLRPGGVALPTPPLGRVADEPSEPLLPLLPPELLPELPGRVLLPELPELPGRVLLVPSELLSVPGLAPRPEPSDPPVPLEPGRVELEPGRVELEPGCVTPPPSELLPASGPVYDELPVLGRVVPPPSELLPASGPVYDEPPVLGRVVVPGPSEPFPTPGPA